jgi:hypothetical protein
LSPFWVGFGGGASGALVAGAALSLLPFVASSSSGCLIVGTVESIDGSVSMMVERGNGTTQLRSASAMLRTVDDAINVSHGATGARAVNGYAAAASYLFLPSRKDEPLQSMKWMPRLGS